MFDEFQGNQQPRIWTATKAGVLCDVASDVLLGKGQGGGGRNGRCPILHAVGSEQYFLFVMKSSTSSNLLLNFITKLQRILCLLLEYTPSNFWKCNSCTKRENNFYSHYIIPNLKIRVNHMNKSMTFKKYSKCSNTLLC